MSVDCENWVVGWENCVPGDGTDQTIALQALIDALPASGGTILLKGDVRVSSLDLVDRRYIRLLGLGSIGTGAAVATLLGVTNNSPSASAYAIDLRGSNGCGFENMRVHGVDAAFLGSLIKYGLSPVGGNEAVYPFIRNCIISGVGGTLLDLRGCTQGDFTRVSFRGSPKHIKGTDNSPSSFSNLHKFVSCSFNPTNQYPVYYPGENWMFDTCNVQAGSSDGAGRFINGAPNARFKNLSLKNVTMYDVLPGGAPNTIWLSNMFGTGLAVEDCLFGANNGGYGVELCGTVGIRILGNRMSYGNAMILAAKDGVVKAGGGLITANVINYQNLIEAPTNMDLSTTDSYGNRYLVSGTGFYNRAVV
jgi:hypothetical protein